MCPKKKIEKRLSLGASFPAYIYITIAPIFCTARQLKEPFMNCCKFLMLLHQEDDGIYSQNERGSFYHCCFQEVEILEEVSEDRVPCFDLLGRKEIDFGMDF